MLISSREFTHRVKSISMAKFTAQEVSALQEGGNQVPIPICAKTYDRFIPLHWCYVLFLS